jgi:hypothetical protein
MRKIKTLAALTAALTLAISSTAFAAPSPQAGVVSIVVPGDTVASVASVKVPTANQLSAIGSFISSNAASLGLIPSVKGTITIEAPANYKGGDVPVLLAAAGLTNGARNVFAYILLPNGKTVIVPCTVRNGYVGFMAPAFGTVSIVVLNTPAEARAAGNATLH